MAKRKGRAYGDFDKSTILKEYKGYIRSINIFIGGYFGPSHYIYIDGKSKDKLIKYGYSPNGMIVNLKEKNDEAFLSVGNFKVIKPTEEDWNNFIDALSECDVDNWNDNYNDSDILDGTQWEIEIKMQERNSIYKQGSNVYPPKWLAFIKVLQKHIDMRIGKFL